MSINKLTLAQLYWSVEGVPVSNVYDDVYFNTENGLEEIEHNFIECNFLTERFANLAPKASFRIVETGFGSGLNFLRAVELFLEKANPSSELHFISFEKHPMVLEDLTKAHQLLPKNRTKFIQAAKDLQANYPLLLPGWHDVYLFENRVRLTLWFGDVQKGLPELDASLGCKMDAWFLDGFAPVKNPDMWTATLYQQMARLSHESTTFSTFTAAGDVRRGLAKAGFEVKKRSGFGLKREMCFGKLNQVRSYSLKAPWFSRPTPINNGNPATAIVIGAGLAGAAVANKLAENVWQVTVLEEQAEVASLASGNLAGTVHPLVTADWNLRSQWYLQGFEATLRTLLPWLKTNKAMGDLSGLVELAMDEKALVRNQQALERVGLPESLVQPVNAPQASDILGTAVENGGMFFHQGGWVYPKEVVKTALAQKNINVSCETSVQAIKQITTHNKNQESNLPNWQIEVLKNGQPQTFNANVVVVATGSLNQQLNQQLGLPIRPVKGQVTHLESTQQNLSLKKPLTHEGYAACFEGGAVTGATFEAPDMSMELSQQSHEHNLNAAFKAMPNWLTKSPKQLANEVQGRVAFRPTTPDHLPIMGPVVDFDWLEKAYLQDSHTHAAYRYPEQQYQAGLFVSNGHGPRGLMSVFLAAETIYADIAGKPLPQSLSLYHASHPARFKIRHWRSGKQKSE